MPDHASFFNSGAGVPLTSGQTYSAGHTDDLRQALVYISTRFPKARLIGIGFSLGANVIIRYIAQEGHSSRLRAGCTLGSVSVPFLSFSLIIHHPSTKHHHNTADDASCFVALGRTMECYEVRLFFRFTTICRPVTDQQVSFYSIDRLDRSFFLRNVYSKSMGTNLVAMVKRNDATVSKFPDDNPLKALLPELYGLKSPTLYDVDNVLTRRVGGSPPNFPFSSTMEYYRWASCHHVLGDVRVPLLCINAGDDPIVGHLPYNVGNSPYTVLFVTPSGGHLGWFEPDGSNTRWGVRRWIVQPAIEWLRAVGEDLVEVDPPKFLPVEVVDGWTREVGRDHLGYTVVGDVGHVVGVEGEGGLFKYQGL